MREVRCTITTADKIDGKKPKEFIIGIHDTGCALADQHANEDAAVLIELILKKVDARKKELKAYGQFP